MEVLAMDKDVDSSDSGFILSRQARLEGEEEPIQLYMQGPYNWRSIAETPESDAVFESSGVIGW